MNELDGLIVVLTQDTLAFLKKGNEIVNIGQRMAGTCGRVSYKEGDPYIRVDFSDGWFVHLDQYHFRVPHPLEQLADCAE